MARLTLPLFPLQDAVLFPGMVLPLHIFEPRYIGMVTACLAGDRRFGVTLLAAGAEVGGPAEPTDIGTTAVIQEYRQVAENRYLLLAIGESRFRIARHWVEGELLHGELETFTDAPSELELGPLCVTLRQQATEHLELLSQTFGRPVPAPPLPDDAEPLSFLLSASLQADPVERQALLELTDTHERLQRLHDLLTEQTALLRERIAVQAEADKVIGGNGSIGHKHLDLDQLDRPD